MFSSLSSFDLCVDAMTSQVARHEGGALYLRQSRRTPRAGAETRPWRWGLRGRLVPEPPRHVGARRAGSRSLGRRSRALAASLPPARGGLGAPGCLQALQRGRAQGET